MTGSNDFSEDSADQSGQTDNIQQSSLPKVPLVKLQNVRKDPLIELRVLFHRQWVLMVRDPLVYVGRAVGMLFVCSVLASVYVSIRSNSQDQSVNKLWFLCWVRKKTITNDEYRDSRKSHYSKLFFSFHSFVSCHRNLA